MFLDELSDVVSTLCSGSTDCILLAGDLNCPGSSPDTVDEQLAEVFHSFGLTQHVQQPTRCCPTVNNLLDIVAADATLPVSAVSVDDAGHVSDHRLVTCKLCINVPPKSAVPFHYRRINSINTDEFQNSLRDSALFTKPASTVD